MKNYLNLCYGKGTVHHAFLWRPLTCFAFVLMFPCYWHPRFRYFEAIVPVDVIRVKSYVDGVFYLSCMPVRVPINKLYIFPQRIVSGLILRVLKRRSSECVLSVYLCCVDLCSKLRIVVYNVILVLWYHASWVGREFGLVLQLVLK